jgi:SNF2 family DNA or RNA helicase
MSEEEERLAEIELEQKKIDQDLIPLESHDKAIENLRKQIRALEAARETIKAENYHKRLKKTALDREADTLVGRIKLRREQERQAAEMLARQAELDELTKDALWRTGVTNHNGEVMKIMDHQLVGAKFMATARRVICADEMGLGKTIESIAAADMMKAQRILLVTPGEVMSGFLSEINMWTGRPAIVLGRKPKAQVFNTLHMIKQVDKMSGGKQSIVVIVNYEAWSRNKKLLTALEGIQFDTVILDEAHRVKETDTSAYQGVDQIINSFNTCGKCGGAVLSKQCTENLCSQWQWDPHKSVENVILLTGTPLLNRPTELYPLLSLIAPDIFYSRMQFIRMFCENVSENPSRPEYVFREGGFDALANKIQGMYIRRTLKDTGITLPPQEVRVHEIDLDPNDYPLQFELMTMLREHAQIVVDENPGIDFMSQLALITRMRQAAVWPGGIKLRRQAQYPDGSYVYFEDPDTGETKPMMEELTIGDRFRESVKLDVCMDMLKSYVKEEGKRVVIFTQFAEVIRELIERCEHAGIRATGFFGDTDTVDRDIIKRNFDRKIGEAAKWDVVIAHYKTGGVGVNFTACERMILTDEEWNPGMEDQAMKRINRIGQTAERTIVDILRLNDYIDTWLAALIAGKRAMINNFNEKNELYGELRKMLLRSPEKKEG